MTIDQFFAPSKRRPHDGRDVMVQAAPRGERYWFSAEKPEQKKTKNGRTFKVRGKRVSR